MTETFGSRRAWFCSPGAKERGYRAMGWLEGYRERLGLWDGLRAIERGYRAMGWLEGYRERL